MQMAKLSSAKHRTVKVPCTTSKSLIKLSHSFGLSIFKRCPDPKRRWETVAIPVQRSPRSRRGKRQHVPEIDRRQGWTFHRRLYSHYCKWQITYVLTAGRIRQFFVIQSCWSLSILWSMACAMAHQGKGYPDVNTRRFLRRLWDELQLPPLALVDADPHGISIHCVYRFGSQVKRTT